MLFMLCGLKGCYVFQEFLALDILEHNIYHGNREHLQGLLRYRAEDVKKNNVVTL